jgi:Gpi18-like mannosyltransferase
LFAQVLIEESKLTLTKPTELRRSHIMNNLFTKKTYFALFAGFFAFEAVLSVWTGMQYDMDIWFNTGRWLHQGINIYVPLDHIGYPPLWSFWCDAAYRIYLFSPNLELWRFVIKLPLILSHLALAFAVGDFVANQFNRKIARRVFLVALTFSFFIFIGAMWGQINTLSALLTFLAFYALTKDHISVSALLLGIAVTLKVYPLIVLPAFLIYLFRKKNVREAGKFSLYALALPVLFTVAVFSVFQWDIDYLFRTIFYWTPVYGSNPTQIAGGCMNLWSFMSLMNLDVSQIWVLRLIWIPAITILAVYWAKQRDLNLEHLNLSIISFYLLFMITYAWIPEQTLIDPLPFIFLQVFAFKPKKVYIYLLLIIQALIYAFSATNWGIYIFNPFLQKFSPITLTVMSSFNPSNSQILAARGIFGLAISLALAVFLLALAKPSLIEKTKAKFSSLKFQKQKPQI